MATDKRTIKFEITADADARAVDKFRSALSAFSQEAPIAEKTLKQVRDAMVEFSKTAEPTSKSINNQIRAFETLRSEVKLGSPLWRQLGNDIADVKGKIGLFTGGLGKAADAQERLNKLIDAPILKLNTFGKLAEHAGKLKAELTGLSYRSEEYLRTLTRIRELETVGSFNQGRLDVIANNRAFMSGTLARGSGSSGMMAALPDTLAGDAQLVSELTQRIQNLDRGSELYLQTVKELTVAQRQQAAAQQDLNRAMAVTDGSLGRRRAEGAAAANLSLAERAAGERERRRQFTSAAELESWQQAGRDRVDQVRGDLDLGAAAASQRERRRQFEQGRAAREAAAETALWQSAGRQRVSQLRYGDDLAAQARVERERKRQFELERAARAQAPFLAGRDVSETPFGPERPQDYQRRMQQQREARQLERRRGFQELGRTATAVGVAGYFGGPEAVAGAGLGALLGPGGAAIGTTVGLAAGGLRAQVAGFSGQAAELDKMRIALKSNTTSAQEYARSLNIIETANKQLNIPLQEGTRGFTQLLAAVKGAGGTINDAEIAYRAINSAIKANGGSTQDAEGAMRALVQTFSKGKVSAEELRGQLAERLPGAVTLFAKSLGMTGPELDKALEQGKVGLGDLMTFLVELEKRSYTTAERIAASQAEAGIRLQNQWQRAVIEIGKAFQPLGAEIQDTLAKALADNQNTIKEWARVFAESVKAAINAFGALGNEIEYANKIIKGLPSNVRIGLDFSEWIPFVKILRFIESTRRDATNSTYKPDAYISGLGGRSQVRNVFESQRGVVSGNIARLTDEAGKLQGSWLPVDRKRLATVEATLKIERDKLSKLDQAIRSSPAGTGSLTPSGQLRNNPAEDKSGESAARKAEAEAERQMRLAQAYADQQQKLLEARTDLEIRLADSVYKHKVDLANREYDRKRQLENALAQAQINRLSPARRGVAQRELEFQQFRARQSDEVRAARQAVEEAQRNLQNERQRAAVSAMAPAVMAPVMTGGGSAIGRYRQGSIGPTSTGPHFHVMRRDGSFYSRNALDQYTEVDGRPLSSGLTVSGGRYGAPRSYGGHSGWDFAFGRGATLGLRNGAQWIGNKPGTGVGDRAAFMTPDGKIYEIIHGNFLGKAQPGTLAKPAVGQFAQERRAAGDQSGVAMREQELKNAQGNLAAIVNGQAAGAQAEWDRMLSESSKAMDDNTRSIQENVQQLQDRTRLTLEGFKPEQIDGMVQINSLQRAYNEEIDQNIQLLFKAKANNDTEGVQRYTAVIEDLGRAFNGNVAAINAQTDATIRSNEALRQLEAQKSLIQGIGNTLFNGIASAITAIVSGTKEWGKALKEIASNILADIGQQLLRFGLSALLKGSGIGIGGVPLFGGFFADGGRPPLGKISVVGERGPELFVPDTAGTIVPNHKLAAALAPSQPTVPAGPIEVKVQTQVINGVEYATVDQLRVATRQAAERGQAMAMNRLQRSTRTRKKVGV